jgi:hypothetical protein
VPQLGVADKFKRRLNSEDICYHSIQNIQSSSLLPRLEAGGNCIMRTRFDTFLASQYNEVFLGYQLGKVVQFCRDQHFEDHLCPRSQGC